MNKGTWRKDEISFFALHTDHVETVTKDGARWIVDDGANSIGAIIVDSVDGASPTSLSDLFDKLSALIA